MQQLNATIHDPYTNNDLAPEVVGGRPRDYIQPQPQPVQDQPRGPRRRAMLFGR